MFVVGVIVMFMDLLEMLEVLVYVVVVWFDRVIMSLVVVLMIVVNVIV